MLQLSLQQTGFALQPLHGGSPTPVAWIGWGRKYIVELYIMINLDCKVCACSWHKAMTLLGVVTMMVAFQTRTVVHHCE